MNEYRPIGIDTAVNMLSQLFGAPYVISNDKETTDKIGEFKLDKGYELEDAEIGITGKVRKSQFGTNVLGSFWMKEGKYQFYDTNDRLDSYDISSFEFPLATIVDFSRPKNIVKSETIGGKGTVKEIMGLGDWQISIKGLIVHDESRVSYQRTIDQQMNMLDVLSEIVGSIKIEGHIFARRHIHSIVIEELTYSAVQGKPGLVQYEIKAVSDNEYFL